MNLRIVIVARPRHQVKYRWKERMFELVWFARLDVTLLKVSSEMYTLVRTLPPRGRSTSRQIAQGLER
jgi:hypothetical protein